MQNARRRVCVLLFVIGLAAVAGAKPSSGTWTLIADFDTATIVKISSRPDRYAFDLVSSYEQGIIGSGVTFHPNGVLKFSEIAKLSTDFAIVQGGTGGGSPRFSIGIDVNGDGVFEQAADGSGPDGHVFIYFGNVDTVFNDPPNPVWANSGNFIGSTDHRFDCTQIGSSNSYPNYDNYAGALALAGNKQVMYIYLTADGWWFGEQEVLVNNVKVNDSVLTAKKP